MLGFTLDSECSDHFPGSSSTWVTLESECYGSPLLRIMNTCLSFLARMEIIRTCRSFMLAACGMLTSSRDSEDGRTMQLGVAFMASQHWLDASLMTVQMIHQL